MKTAVKALALSMVIGSLVMGMIPGESATVSTAKGKVKLSSKSVKIAVGEKKYIYVKNYFKKVKWKSNNKKIATVKNGTIKGKKAGGCIITAKAGKKKLKCKVTVTNKKNNTGSTVNQPAVTAAPAGNTLSNSELAAKVTVNMQPVYKSGTVLFTVTNGNASFIDTYKISYQFAGATGVVDSGTIGGCALSPGAVQYCVADVGKDKAKIIDPNLSVVSVTVENYTYTHYVDATSEVTVTLNDGSDASKVPVTYVNSGTGKNTVKGVAIFTDISGNIVLAKSIYSNVDAGATKFDEVLIPYDIDENGKYIEDGAHQMVRVPYAAKKVVYNAYRY